jgi:hypothetical protein
MKETRTAVGSLVFCVSTFLTSLFFGNQLLIGTFHTTGTDPITMNALIIGERGISRTPSGWRFVISD